MDRKMLKQAIADAKLVKETAIANAKAALEESFTPHLKSMLSAKLQEMEDMDEEIEELPNLEEEETLDLSEELEIEEEETLEEETSLEEEEVEEEFNLDELLAELEEYDTSEESLNENEEEEEEEEDEDQETMDLENMSEDDLKKFIEDVIKDMVESGEIESDETEEEEEVDIEVEEEDEEEVDIDELLAEARKTKKPSTSTTKSNPTDLQEAYKVIKKLSNTLDEVNLLNAKLLYSNKILKTNKLNENQIITVLGTLDKAKTVKEAKLVYETLIQNISSKKEKPNNLRENLGFASKTKAPKRITESTTSADILDPAMVSRFQKIAGII